MLELALEGGERVEEMQSAVDAYAVSMVFRPDVWYWDRGLEEGVSFPWRDLLVRDQQQAGRSRTTGTDGRGRRGGGTRLQRDELWRDQGPRSKVQGPKVTVFGSA